MSPDKDSKIVGLVQMVFGIDGICRRETGEPPCAKESTKELIDGVEEK